MSSARVLTNENNCRRCQSYPFGSPGRKSFRDTLLNKAFRFITTKRIIWEVKKYIPELAGKLEVDDTDLYYALENLPILTLQTRFYDEQTELAERLISHRDNKDVDLLALSLAIDAPIWTQDKDFEGIGQITLLKTSDMVKIVAQDR